MLAIFLITIIVGLVLFGLTFFREAKTEIKSLGRPHLRDLPREESSRPHEEVSTDISDEAVLGDEPKISGLAGEKWAKLERMIEEKNKLLMGLETDLRNEQAHRAEFDRIRELLQQQIEEQKKQNRKIKEELAKTLQDNLDLQTKVFNLEHGIKEDDREHEGSDFVRAEPDISPREEKKPSVGLHDVFDEIQDEDKKKEENGDS